MQLTDNALTVLKKRYLRKDDNGNVIESPEDLVLRVCEAVALADKKYGRSDREVSETAEMFYGLLSSLDFLPNSPTLMNAGRELGQLSGCFVLPVGDSMEDIFDAVKYTALIHKSGGGTGFSFSRLRPKNDAVKTTKGVSSGPISFMTVFDAATETVKQGGMRRGANMGILRVDHPDVIEFITCKHDNAKLNNFNISVAVTDEFMKAVAKDETYSLKSPKSGVVVATHKAREVFDLIVKSAWKNGDPGIVFIDRINKDNPTPQIGAIEATNPCGEQPLLPNESCNLGSINLSNMVVNGDSSNGYKMRVDETRLISVTRKAVAFLDNVVDINKYPLPQIAEMTLGNRKIGLGVMGFADMCFKLGVKYDSEDGLQIAEYIMSTIQRIAHEESMHRGLERGNFPNYVKSVFPDVSSRRNAAVTTIAPTGTLSIIAGCSSGIEPLFSLVFTRRILDGAELLEVNQTFEAVARARGFYSESLMKEILKKGSIQGIAFIPDEVKKVFVTAHDITPEWHIRMQAAFQKYTDNAVSKTVNFPNSATEKDVADVYLTAYYSGCKGVTIYRDGSRDHQPMSTCKQSEKIAVVAETRPRTRPRFTHGVTQKVSTGCGNFYVTVNEDDRGVCEIFAAMGKSGGCAASQIEAVSRLISLALRSGVDPKAVIKQIRGIRCPKPRMIEGGTVLSCADALGEALGLHIHMTKKSSTFVIEGVKDGEFKKDMMSQSAYGLCPECPECQNMMEIQEGCAVCRSCGYSQCA